MLWLPMACASVTVSAMLVQREANVSPDHTAPMCSVARAMVMSGTDNHVAMQQLLYRSVSHTGS